MKLPGTFAGSRGFTTVELLLVVGILLVVFGASASILSRAQVSAQIQEVTDGLAQQLRSASLRARANEGGAGHGVHIGSTTYTVYRGDSYDTRDTAYDRIFSTSPVMLTGGTLAATTSATNVAQGQSASASTQFSVSYPPSNGNDGNINTYWFTSAGQSNDGWWQVDLGSAHTIIAASVRWFNTGGTYNCTKLDIMGSNNPASFSDVLWTGNTVSGGQEQTYTFASAGTYRYWRFFCDTANNASYYVIREARLFPQLLVPGDPDYPFMQGTGFPTNTGTIQIADPVGGSHSISVNAAGTVLVE